MRIYVIGPVSGFDDLNRPAFERARDMLQEAGYIPLIPHDFVSSSADWQKAMRSSLECIAKADGIGYLDGWKKSFGARIEWRIAMWLGIEVAAVESWAATGSHKQAMAERYKKRKRCPRCKRILPVTLFDASLDNASGLQSMCRDCMADSKREGNT